MNELKSLSVLIPFYNEEKNLSALIQRICEIDRDTKFLYIFIDDGSKDKSRDSLNAALKKTQLKFLLYNLEKNQGKSAAIKSSLDLVTTSHFVILDADLELDPGSILPMWKIIEDGIASAVFGFRRFLSHSSFTYRYTLGNKFISNWFGIFFNVVHTDIMCGLKMLPTDIIKKGGLRLKRFAIEIELPMILWKNNIRVHEVEVDYRPRGWEDGKVIGVRDAIYILLSIMIRRIRFGKKINRVSSFVREKS